MDYGILVNKENKLDKNYVPDNLVLYNEFNGKRIDDTVKTYVVKEAYDHFVDMNNQAMKKKYCFVIDSGYRSYDYQVKILDFYIKEKGKNQALKMVATPGTSEHQTGLAIDVALKISGNFVDDFNDNFPEIKWLHKNMYKYGFILRYPKGYENITGYSYECWHIRYVGEKIAKFMHDNKIYTLEEFCAKNKNG